MGQSFGPVHSKAKRDFRIFDSASGHNFQPIGPVFPAGNQVRCDTPHWVQMTLLSSWRAKILANMKTIQEAERDL
jgi:hypothetical protein